MTVLQPESVAHIIYSGKFNKSKAVKIVELLKQSL